MNRRQKTSLIIAAVIAGILIFLRSGVGVYINAIWFTKLGYLSVYTKSLTAKWAFFLGGFLVSAVFLYINGWFALRAAPQRIVLTLDDVSISIPKLIKLQKALVALAAFFVGLIFAGAISTRWLQILAFFERQPFGATDPVFGKDIGFYVFSLPVYVLGTTWLMWLFILAFGLSAVIYFLGGSFLSRLKELRAVAKAHLSILAALTLLVLAGRFWLERFQLLYSRTGAVFGAGYADIHAKLPAYWIMVIATLVIVVGILLAITRRGWKIVVAGTALFVLMLVLAVGIYPSLVQKLVVEPNELEKEKPYIAHNIRLTRLAYGLDSVEEKGFDPSGSITYNDLLKYQSTVRNMRLWDWRPLHATYSQLQEIRLYYDFHDVDVDRYMFGNDYRQVMLSARELNYDQIPAQARTWVNLHLKYTHGYGVVMNPVNLVTEEGLPYFFIRDIPPVVTVDIELDQPAIYYGEETTEYALVKTATEEFDYPVGERNKFTTYTGSGGVKIGSFLRRLAFAYEFGSAKLILTSYITGDSRIMYHRTISERIRTVAPFLLYENDPYAVIVNGRLFWIEDGYTTSSTFPYSEPYQNKFNYIRNSVKVVVDAYNGDVSFYIADPEDPIIRAYAAIFPKLFKPLSELPDEFKHHLRYPVGLFSVQTSMYATYHMRDPQTFYNREDVWQIPREVYAGAEQPMEPYYVLMQLPGESEGEYILMLPFTPKEKDNMIAWIAARCDPPNYGQMFAYMLPKQRLVYGPRQIEARIDQDPDISRLLTLWSQRGSQVIRGNLLAIPIDSVLLYVEPVYLRAENGQLPELKRVIVAYKNRIVMRETLDLALQDAIGTTEVAAQAPREVGEAAPSGVAIAPQGTAELAAEAMQYYEEAMRRLRNGDWAGYGEQLEKLRAVLEELVKQTRSE